MNYCGKCGRAISDEVKFCPYCGERTGNEGTDIPVGQQAPARKVFSQKRGKTIIILLVAAAVVLGMIFVLTGNSGYKQTVTKYFKAIENEDSELMTTVIAQYYLDYMDEAYGEKPLGICEDMIDSQRKDWKCGDELKISYKIIDKKHASKEERENLRESIYDRNAYYVYEDEDDFILTDAYVLEIDFTVKGNKDKQTFHFEDGLLVIKENGKWRIPMGTIHSRFYSND